MKKLISIILIAVTLFALVSCSCVRGDSKYDYKDLTKYIRLPNFREHVFDFEEDAIKQAIASYLQGSATEYTVQSGDRINVDLTFYTVNPDIDKKDKEITELKKDDIWIEKINRPQEDGSYTIGRVVEEEVIGKKLKETITRKLTLDSTFFAEEYRGQAIYVDITVNNIECELGDVVIASYKGYYLNEDGTIVKENDKDKTFDSSDSSKFFLGSHLAIEDFEQGIVGMTVGVEKDIYATFPEDYTQKPELAGQKVLFKVTVKSLYTPPAYNDKFVQTYFTEYSNVEEFEKALRKEYTLTLVLNYILENVQIIEYPKAEYKAAEKQLEEIEGTFAANMQMTLDEYIKQQYKMTRDAYIKSNMKTEMIYYALRNLIGEKAVPTEEEISAKRDALISEYKNYYMTSEKMDESSALSSAKDFVDSLGESYIYEEVLYVKIDTMLPDLVKVNIVPAPYDNYIFDAQDK